MIISQKNKKDLVRDFPELWSNSSPVQLKIGDELQVKKADMYFLLSPLLFMCEAWTFYPSSIASLKSGDCFSLFGKDDQKAKFILLQISYEFKISYEIRKL